MDVYDMMDIYLDRLYEEGEGEELEMASITLNELSKKAVYLMQLEEE